MNKKKVILIGWDAADWNVISPLLDAGEMPALNRLINNGVMGNISTLDPPLSPILWTSIATGKHADKHGILAFTEPDTKNGGIRPVTLHSRKTRAIWNILNANDLKCNVISWWPSHPAEPINGLMVSNFYQQSHKDFDQPWPLYKDSVHPAELYDIMAELRVHKMELTEEHVLPFIPKAATMHKDLYHFLDGLLRVIAEAASVHSATTWALENTEWDFTAVYFDAIDHICHGFMRFHPPQLPGIPDEGFDLFRDVVNGIYKFHDMMLERIVQLAGPDTIYIIVSDHGFHSGKFRFIEYPKFASAPALEHRPYGVLCISGPGIIKDERIYGATLLDITPTILSIYGLPIGKDMDGKPLFNAFEKPPQITFIESWDNEAGDFGTHPGYLQTDAFASAEVMKQLIELGYVEDFGEDKNLAAQRCKLETELNLALVYNARRKYDLSQAILEELAISKADDFRVHLALVDCYINQKKTAEASKSIEHLRKLNEVFLPHVDFYEGIIHGINNDTARALELFHRVEKNTETFPGLALEMGRVYLKIEKYSDAIKSFNKVLEMDDSNAQAYLGKGIALLRLERLEESVDSLLTSIGLLYNFAPAHYHLGEALYKMGKYTEASQAFEIVLKFVPNQRKACQWLAKIYSEHLGQKEKAQYYESLAKKKELGEVIVVSGLPRSGTSLMMQILEAAGLEIFSDKLRQADENNPKGYYEHEGIKALLRDNKIIYGAVNKVVKIIAQLLPHVPVDLHYKVIFMERDINEVIASQMKMLKKPGVFPVALSDAFKKDMERVRNWAQKEPYVDILYVRYNELIENPLSEIRRICEFIGLSYNKAEDMIMAIDKNLYRTRL